MEVNLLCLLGKYCGKKIAKSKWLDKKIFNFNINISGLENIKNIKGTFILASNHVRPLDGGLFKTGIAPDSFIIKQIISQNLNKNLSVVANFGLKDSRIYKLLEEFTKGLVIGLNGIAVKAGDKKSFREDFLKGVENAISKERVILIHPAGKYYDDFEAHHEIKAGAAYIALKYDLAIVPVYIKGCTNWNKKGQKVFVSLGKPIESKGKIDKISEEIKDGMLKLKEDKIDL
ncbi:MAG: 1-acyl-sn-glycerol-3-phosphate acyltransferase [Candidatus Levybacteria bacterium]|nr:1-acyl-sn-glycerol-3-phosphate acyltransferase [Candidatus Levybacteria bacterium]